MYSVLIIVIGLGVGIINPLVPPPLSPFPPSRLLPWGEGVGAEERRGLAIGKKQNARRACVIDGT